METQLEIISKEEAYKLIDEMPGDKVLVLTFNTKSGNSNNGVFVKKKKGKKMTKDAATIVLSNSNPIMTLSLHNTFFTDFTKLKLNGEDIVKSIMLANLVNKANLGKTKH